MAPFQSPVHTIRSVAPAGALSIPTDRSMKLSAAATRLVSVVAQDHPAGEVVGADVAATQDRANPLTGEALAVQQAVRTWPRPGTPAIEQARPN
jgi:hypothetical protein